MKACVSAGPAPAPTPPTIGAGPVILYKKYDTSDCTGSAAYTAAYVQGVCNDNSYETSIESVKYTCNNNVPSAIYYSGSATCTGTASVSPQPTTCIR